MKICVGASSGGHMNQLLKLLEYSDEWMHNPYVYITTLDVLAPILRKRGDVYVIGEADRLHPFKAVIVLCKSLHAAFKERPDIVITTGAMPLAFFCFFSKLFGARIVWIDSVANIDKLSLSGRFVKLFSNLFITQWPDLATPDGKIQYVGEIL